jgi:hypothetical protein
MPLFGREMIEPIDIYCPVEERTGMRSYYMVKRGFYRLSRGDGMLDSIALGNTGFFPSLEISDGLKRLLFLCPNVFMTGTFRVQAGFLKGLFVKLWSGGGDIVPQISFIWRDDEE